MTGADVTWEGESLATATVGEGYEKEKITGDCDYVLQQLIADERQLNEIYIAWSWAHKDREYRGYAIIEPDGDVEFWDSRLKDIGQEEHIDIRHRVEGSVNEVLVLTGGKPKRFKSLGEAISFAKEHEAEFDELEFDIKLPSVPLPGGPRISSKREEVFVHIPFSEDHIASHKLHKERVDIVTKGKAPKPGPKAAPAPKKEQAKASPAQKKKG
jgi:hypothetical protein